MAGEIDNSEIPEERTKTMAYNATFIRILAGCYREWIENEENWISWQTSCELLRYSPER